MGAVGDTVQGCWLLHFQFLAAWLAGMQLLPLPFILVAEPHRKWPDL